MMQVKNKDSSGVEHDASLTEIRSYLSNTKLPVDDIPSGALLDIQ